MCATFMCVYILFQLLYTEGITWIGPAEYVAIHNLKWLFTTSI